MRVCAVIVAGGRSVRMGREKALEVIGGQTILSRIVARLKQQVSEVTINANGEVGRFDHTGLSVIRDIRPEIGSPLAGLHAALHFAIEQHFDAVLTVPSDVPFLPSDLVKRLSLPDRCPAIAASGGQSHYLTGLWPRTLLDQLVQVLDQPRPLRLQDWARLCGATVVSWPVEPYDPFFNVNTPEDLAAAERIAAEFNL